MKKRALFLTAVAVLSAFNAACTRNPQEQARHDSEVADMLDRAMERCDHENGVNNSTEAYSQRLTHVLQKQSTDALQTLNRMDVALCLDQRLPAQKNGFFSRHMDEIYYGRAHIVSIPDTGAAYDPDAWSQDNPAFRVSSRYQTSLANALEREGHTAGTHYAYSYKPHKRSRRYRWNDFNAASSQYKQNPQLHRPPLSQKARPARTMQGQDAGW